MFNQNQPPVKRTPIKPIIASKPFNNVFSPAKLPDSPGIGVVSRQRGALSKCIEDLATDDFKDARYLELKLLTEQVASVDEWMASLIKLFQAEKKTKSVKSQIYPYSKSWEKYLSTLKQFRTSHDFFALEDPAFLTCPQNLVKVCARTDKKYADLAHDPDKALGTRKHNLPVQREGDTQKHSDSEDEDLDINPVDEFLDNALHENIIETAALGGLGTSVSDTQNKAINSIAGRAPSGMSVISSTDADSAYSSGGQSSSTIFSGGPIDEMISGGQTSSSTSGGQDFEFRNKSSSAPVSNKRKYQSADGEEEDPVALEKSRKIGQNENEPQITNPNEPLTASVLQALLVQQTQQITTNCSTIATNSINKYHNKWVLPEINALKNSNVNLTTRMTAIEEKLDNAIAPDGVLGAKITAVIEEKWSSFEPSTADEHSNISDNAVYASYIRKRKNYSNVLNEVIESATLKLDLNGVYATRTQETFSINHDKLKGYLKTEYKVVKTWVRVDANNIPKGLSGVFQLKDAGTKSRGQLAIDAVAGRKDSGGLGVNFKIPDEYDCSNEFFDWMERKIITNFSVNKNARYLLIIDSETVIAAGCPLELVKLSDTDPQALKENLMKLADFTKFFPSNGKVLPVPDKYVKRQQKRAERSIRSLSKSSSSKKSSGPILYNGDKQQDVAKIQSFGATAAQKKFLEYGTTDQRGTNPRSEQAGSSTSGTEENTGNVMSG